MNVQTILLNMKHWYMVFHKAISLIVKYLKVFGDSKIVRKYVRNIIHCVSIHLRHYQSLIQTLTSHFISFNISPIPRLQNFNVDLLANVESKLIPPKDFSRERFSIELIFLPSIPENITNWRVLNDDEDTLIFITSEGYYSNQIIGEYECNKQLNKSTEENSLPKPVVKLDDLYDLKYMFKMVTNCKLQSLTMRFEFVNLRSYIKPQNINLGLGLSPYEIFCFIRVLKRYKNASAWNYEYLKNYDTSIIQHTIPMLPDVNLI